MSKGSEYGFSIGLSNNDPNRFSLGINKISPIREDEFDLKKPDFLTVRGNVPVVLLRRKFESTPKWNKLQFVFCDFRETVSAFNSKNVDILRKSKKILSFRQSIFGFRLDVIKDLIENDSGYNIVKSIIFRLYYAHSLIDYYTSLKDFDTTFRLQLFADTHIDLCSYMNENQVYNDHELNDPDSNHYDLVHSALEKYYPHQKRFIFCGDLPDLTPCIDQGNIWYDVRPKQITENVVSAIIHLIACKTETQKCQDRNFLRILYGYFENFPVLYQLYKIMIEVSLLGNYPHAKERPKFGKRIEITENFRSTFLTESSFFLWMNENEDFVYYCTKELYAYMIQQQYSIDVMKSESSHWTKIKSMIFEAMDISRSYVSRSNGNRDGFIEIKKEISTMHQETLKYLTKLRKGTFLDIAINEMNKFYDKSIVDKYSASIQNSEMELSQEVLDAMDIVIKQRYTIYIDNVIETKWLICFGITKNGFEEIRNLYFDYEVKDIADNAIIRRIERIYKANKLDFHIIRCYLKKIYDHKSFGEYKLCYRQAFNQKMALRSKFFVPPWEGLSEDSDLFYYCEICKKWSNPIIDPISKKTSPNVYALGLEKALYDYTTDSLYCGKQNTSINVRKLMDNGLYYKEGKIEDQKAAKTIRKHKEVARCCDTKLVPVNMIGIIKKLNNKLWALCEICGGLTEFEGAKLGKLGFTCGMHHSDIMLHIKSSDNHEVLKNQAHNYTLIARDRLEEMKSIWYGDLTLGKDEPLDIHKLRCYYCEVGFGNVKEKMIPVKILDDQNIFKMTFIRTLLCNTDFDKVSVLFEEGRIPKRSDILRLIQEQNRKNIAHISGKPSFGFYY
jgi:hypothetical protein